MLNVAEGTGTVEVRALPLTTTVTVTDVIVTESEALIADGVYAFTETTVQPLSDATFKATTPLGVIFDVTGNTDGTEVVESETIYYQSTGDNVQFEGIHFRSQPAYRTTSMRGRYPKGMGRLDVSGNNPTNGSTRATFKACLFDNLYSNSNFSASAGGVWAEDCLSFDAGMWTEEIPTGDGEHWYTQNLLESGLKIVRRQLFGRCFGLAMQQYTETAGKVSNFLLQDVTTLSELYALAGSSRENVTYERVISWYKRLSNGRTQQTQRNIKVLDSTVVGASLVVGASIEGCVVTGNTVVRPVGGTGTMNIGENFDATLTVDNNHYYGGVTLVYAGITRTWAQWQALGFDANGTYSAGLPTTNSVHVVASDSLTYVLGQVTVLNWEEDAPLVIDLNALGVTNGQDVKLRSIDDPLVDVRTLTVSGTSVSVDLTTRTLSVPTGHDTALTPALDIRFSAWRVEVAS